MKFWLICPGCLDSFKGFPGELCFCGEQAVVAPLFPSQDYKYIWDGMCLGGESDIEKITEFKSKYYNRTIYVYCDGDTHFAVDKHDEYLFATACDC